MTVISADVGRGSRRIMAVVVAVLLLAAVGFAGYQAGDRHGSAGHTVAARVYVGEQHASVRVGSWAYDIPTTDGAIPWFDGSTEHDGGTAPCLRNAATYAWVRFGYSPAHGPDGTSWRQVTWVRCIAHP